jgi:hypothetical protein
MYVCMYVHIHVWYEMREEASACRMLVCMCVWRSICIGQHIYRCTHGKICKKYLNSVGLVMNMHVRMDANILVHMNARMYLHANYTRKGKTSKHAHTIGICNTPSGRCRNCMYSFLTDAM